jgi:dTDP-4-dehydrorhamnose 3,5-epimerase
MSGPEVERLPLAGAMLITPIRHGDHRGHLLELYHGEAYPRAGLSDPIVQFNASHSERGVLRGLHYQLRRPQGKLISVLRGEIFDVAVDIGRGSPTFGQWFGVRLSGSNHRQLFVPGTFAHGFCVLSREAEVVYGCTAVHDPADASGIRWDDPDLAIEWPVDDPTLSDKDAQLPGLGELPEEALPTSPPASR